MCNNQSTEKSKQQDPKSNINHNCVYSKMDRPRPSLITDSNGKQRDPCLISNYLNKNDALKYFNLLKKEIKWIKNPRWSLGYKLNQSAFYYDENMRSNKSKQIDILEILCDMISNNFNTNVFTVWCNLFEDNNSYIDWHQDQYGYDCFTLSFGNKRQFIMCNLKNKSKIIADFELNSGDLYFFSQVADSENEHCVPKKIGDDKNSNDVDYSNERISLLFFVDWPQSIKDGLKWDIYKQTYAGSTDKVLK